MTLFYWQLYQTLKSRAIAPASGSGSQELELARRVAIRGALIVIVFNACYIL